MAEQFMRLDFLLFAVFLICGWLVMLIDPSLRPQRPRLFLIGAPLFAILCCLAAFVFTSDTSDTAATPSALQNVFTVFFTALTFLCAVGGVIAVPIALRSRFRAPLDDHEPSVAHHHHDLHDHHSHSHDHHDHSHAHDGEAGHSQASVRAVWIPRQQPPREE